MDALTNMEDLEELIICPSDSSILSVSDLPTYCAPVVLPPLRHLSAEACILGMTCLLDNLDAPSLSPLGI